MRSYKSVLKRSGSLMAFGVLAVGVFHISTQMAFADTTQASKIPSNSASDTSNLPQLPAQAPQPLPANLSEAAGLTAPSSDINPPNGTQNSENAATQNLPAVTEQKASSPIQVQYKQPSAGETDQENAAQIENGKPLALGFLSQEGVKLYYLGAEGCVNGYLGQSPTGQFQTFYVWPDGTDFVTGTLYNANGDDLTKSQTALMGHRFNQAYSGKNVSILPTCHSTQASINPGADISTISAFDFAKGKNLKSLYLGGDGGAPGYMIAGGTKASPVYQTFYVTPDGNHVVAGMMFGHFGQDTTSDQILAKKTAVLDLLKDPSPPTSADTPSPKPDAQADQSAQASNIESTGISKNIEPASPGQIATNNISSSVQPALPVQTEANALKDDAVSKTPATATVSTSSSQAVTSSTPIMGAQSSFTTPEADTDNGLPPVQQVSQKLFMDSAQKSNLASFKVGYNDAPVVWMVADPQCPYSHAAWNKLEPLVMDHKIQLKIILVDGIQGSDKYNQEILANRDPGLVWLQGGGSASAGLIRPDATANASAYKQAEIWLQNNMNFVKMTGISGTPFFAYMGKDGLWRSEQGPNDIVSFLAGDLNPSN